ncbi:MAG: peptide chain release factor N(5)-glutamine methyltransferase [Duncaniella sp.]|nr:peptide chain release factor N(5)-glutamine methyltransferase [Duncaniella sp.]
MILNDLLQGAQDKLTPLYGSGEAKWLVRTIIEHVKGWNQVEVSLRRNEDMSDFIVGKVNDAVDKLLVNEPVQYIFGDTYWYGMTLKVTPDVLIPRPETEELVDMIVKENKSPDLKVLDICTGSGCIAVALAKNLPYSTVRGVDISAAALEVARQNAELQHAKIDFQKNDALSMVADTKEKYDIIVSNPPYIVEREKKNMCANVLDYEPHLALFIPDDEPLKFYKAISEYAFDSLTNQGKLYFEINPIFSDKLTEMLSSQGWSDIQIYPDMYGKKRVARALK